MDPGGEDARADATWQSGSVIVAALGLTGLLAVGCGASADGAESPWAAVRVGSASSEVTPDATSQDLAARSDVVAFGRFTESCGERVVGTDPGVPEQGLVLQCLTFEYDEVYAGDGGPSSVPVEFSVGGDVDAEVLTLPSPDAIAFLVEKRDRPGHYRTINSHGLWATSERGRVDQPMAASAPDDTSPFVGDLLADDPTWEEFRERLAERLTRE